VTIRTVAEDAGVSVAAVSKVLRDAYGVSDSARTSERAIVDNMVDRRMDGLMIIGPRMSSEEVTQNSEQIPVVLIAYHSREQVGFDTVNNDDRLGAALVVQHLVAAGYKHIAYISQALDDPGNVMVTTHRESGFRRAMQEAGLAKYLQVVPAPQTSRDLQSIARHLLQSRNRPEAIFCWTDFVALEVISVARELGLSVPRDLAVVGYDNTTWCDLSQNALTSIDQSGQVLGLQAARLLIERIKGRETPEHFVVTPRLVARDSSRGPKST
jgi:LacI family transcriptional regulator